MPYVIFKKPSHTIIVDDFLGNNLQQLLNSNFVLKPLVFDRELLQKRFYLDKRSPPPQITGSKGEKYKDKDGTNKKNKCISLLSA